MKITYNKAYKIAKMYDAFLKSFPWYDIAERQPIKSNAQYIQDNTQNFIDFLHWNLTDLVDIGDIKHYELLLNIYEEVTK